MNNIFSALRRRMTGTVAMAAVASVVLFSACSKEDNAVGPSSSKSSSKKLKDYVPVTSVTITTASGTTIITASGTRFIPATPGAPIPATGTTVNYANGTQTVVAGSTVPGFSLGGGTINFGSGPIDVVTFCANANQYSFLEFGTADAYLLPAVALKLEGTGSSQSAEIEALAFVILGSKPTGTKTYNVVGPQTLSDTNQFNANSALVYGIIGNPVHDHDDMRVNHGGGTDAYFLLSSGGGSVTASGTTTVGVDFTGVPARKIKFDDLDDATLNDWLSGEEVSISGQFGCN